MSDYKYKVRVIRLERPLRVPKERMEELKGVVKGAMLRRMKLEAVDCPVLERQVPSIECFCCSNFVRRVRGEVDCKGLPLGPR